MGQIEKAGATQCRAFVQLMDAVAGTVVAGGVTVTAWPPIFNHIPGAVSGSLGLAWSASPTNAFSAGAVAVMNSSSNTYQLDLTTSGAAAALAISGKNTTYELIVLPTIQIADSANRFFGANVITDNATGTRNASLTQINGMTISFTGNTMTAGTQSINVNLTQVNGTTVTPSTLTLTVGGGFGTLTIDGVSYVLPLTNASGQTFTYGGTVNYSQTTGSVTNTPVINAYDVWGALKANFTVSNSIGAVFLNGNVPSGGTVNYCQTVEGMATSASQTSILNAIAAMGTTTLGPVLAGGGTISITIGGSTTSLVIPPPYVTVDPPGLAAVAGNAATAAAQATLAVASGGSATIAGIASGYTAGLGLLAAAATYNNTATLPGLISLGAFTAAALAPAVTPATNAANAAASANANALAANIATSGTGPIQTALVGIGGTGAFAVVVPFIGLLQDASTIVLEGVKSTATKNGIPTIAAPSNALGLTTLGLDAGTYRLTPFLQGYTSPSPLPTFAVSSDSTLTPIVLTQVTVTIPVPAGSTAAIIVCDEGTVGIAHTFRITAPPTGETGITYDYTPHTVLSDGSGVVQYACPYGCAMVYQRGKGREVPFTVPTSGTSFNPPDTIG